MKRSMRLGGLALLLALMSASCGDGTGPVATNSFNGTLSGSLSGSKSGPSFYGGSLTNNSFFLFGFESTREFEFMMGPTPAMTGTPTAGTFQIGGENDPYLSVLIVGLDRFEATSGTVTFTSATSKAVRGSFSVTYATAAGGEAVFTGSFNAGKCPEMCAP